MKLYLLFCVCLICGSRISIAQPISLHLTIRNATTKQPLAYATVYSSKAQTGAYSAEDGLVEWRLDASDTITVSFLAYETQKLAVRTLADTRDIFLNETVQQLNTVAVKATKKRRKAYRIGFYDDPTEFDAWGITIGYITVNFIANNTGQPGLLKTLLVDMGKASNQVHRAKARVRVFAANDPRKGPGKDILHDNIIFDIPRFSKHQKVDLTSVAIPFPLEGLFIGIEFLGFETKSGFTKDWKQQTGGRITSTKRDDYRSVGSSWRFPDTDNKPRWINLTDGSKHKAWERTLYKIGAEVETVE